MRPDHRQRRPGGRPATTVAFLLLLPAAALAAGSSSQAYYDQPASFYPGADHAASPPSPEQFLGSPVGRWFVSPADAEAYLRALAAASDRVRIEEYGRTYEGRPLLLATVSSPANLARLDSIRADLARLRETVPVGEALDGLVSGTPLVVWLGYGVHGDEHAGTEAALMTAYHLAADRTGETARWLDSVVVLLDPMQNPDGRSRFLRWQESTVARSPAGDPRPSADPAAAEHNPPWPSGRFNHYLFDLNRDWFFQTQAESQARMAVLRGWIPQVFVDLHEMETNATYFFPPPAQPINPFIAPSLRTWWETFGKGNARMLDSFGVPYYTRERYDAFYPGYGDSFPTLLGAVGMTYEQATAGGLVQRRSDGSTITLREAAWHHFLTSLATIRTAAENREARLRDYAAYFREANREEGAPREIWVQPTAGAQGARELADLLHRLGVRLRFPEGRVANDSLRSLAGDGFPPAALSPDGFAIPLAQPQRRLVQALFEREVPMEESFLRGEREKRERREPDGFYDITAWSIPLAYGVEAYWADRPTSGRLVPDRPASPGEVTGGPPAVAYLLPYDGNDAARALVALVQAEPRIQVHVAREEFRTSGRTFGRGTVVVKSTGNPPELPEVLRRIAAATGVVFRGVGSFLTEQGIDLGSSRVAALRRPRVALLFGPPAEPSSTGWLAYLLEQRWDLAYNRLRPEELDQSTLADLDVLILPDSDALGAGYEEELGEDRIEEIRRWIEGGGTFVGLGGGAAVATRPDVAWTSARPVTQDLEPARGAVGRAAADPRASRALDQDALPDPTPGAIARVLLDPRSFLTLGYGDSVPVPVISRLAFVPGEGVRSAARFDRPERLRISGFMWDETRELLAGEAYLLSETLGRGKVILFAGDPAFRAYWPNLHRLLLNAVLLGPSL